MTVCIFLASMFLPCQAISPPTVTVDNYEDDQWFTEPNITLRGSTKGTLNELVMDVEDFEEGSFHNVFLDGDAFKFHSIVLMEDNFEGTALNESIWEIVSDGNITVKDGNLHLSYDKQNGTFPMIATRGDIFPDDEAWIMETFARYLTPDIHSHEGLGVGITAGALDPYESHSALYVDSDMTFDGLPIVVLSNGTVKDDWNHTNSSRWGRFGLGASPTSDSYSTTWSPSEIGTGWRSSRFTKDVVPKRIWAGHVDGLPDNEETDLILVMKFACVWMNHGDWTSRVYDMGANVTFRNGEWDYETDSSLLSQYRLEVRASPDNETWTGWRGLHAIWCPQEHSRYVQFRVLLTMRTSSDRIAMWDNEITVNYEYPVDRVEVRHAGGEWVRAEGLSQWRFELTLEEDNNLIEVRATDMWGQQSETRLRLILDTLPPVAVAAVYPPAPYTNTRNVTLLVNGTDKYGIAYVHISNTSTMYNMTTIPYQEVVNWSLPQGFGETFAYVQFEDPHGLLSEVVNASIFLDQVAPEASLLIEGGDGSTQSMHVQMDLDYIDGTGIALVEISNDPEFVDAFSIEPGVEVVDEWYLEEGEAGLRTVYLRVTDLAGNVFVASDVIDLWVANVKGQLVINDGAAVTGSREVDLAIGLPDDFNTMRMQVSEDNHFTDVMWEDIITSREWTLSEGDGTKSINIRFEDDRGFWSLVAADSIGLETTPPVVRVTLDGGNEFTTNDSVIVGLTYLEPQPVSSLFLAWEDDFDSAVPIDFAGNFEWDIEGGEGTHVLHVWVSDILGNVAHVSTSIRRATEPPTITYEVVGGNITKTSDSIALKVEAFDSYGMSVEVQLAFDKDPSNNAKWVEANKTHHVILPSKLTDGGHYISIRARNELGLMTQVHRVLVIIDRVPPVVTVKTPKDKEVLVQDDPVVRVKYAVDDATGIIEFSYRVDEGRWVTIEPGDDIRLELDGFGSYKLEFRAKDQAGNVATEDTRFEVQEAGSWQLVIWIAIAIIIIAAVAFMVWHGRRRPDHD